MAENRSYNDSPTFIPSRLESSVHSSIPGNGNKGPVADAKDIYDINHGKWQKDINDEIEAVPADIERIDDELGNRYTKTETDAKVSGAVNTEKQRAEGVEAGLRESIDELGQIGLDPENAISTDGDDFDGDTLEKRSKIPTIGSVLDGADEEPTDGSNKLVKSRAVAKELRPEVTITRDTAPKTGFIGSSNTFNPNSGSGITLAVNSGDNVSIYAKDNLAFIAFLKKNCYSDSLEFCSDFPSRIDILTNFKKVYTVPSDCKYLYVTYSTSSATLGFPVITINDNSVIGSIGNMFNEHNDRILSLNLQVNGNNAEYYRKNGFVNSSIQLRETEGDTSYFVPVKTGDTLFVKASTDNYSLMCFAGAFGSSRAVILMAGETERRTFTKEGTTFVSPGDGLAIITDTVYQYPQTHIVAELAINGTKLIENSITADINALKGSLQTLGEDIEGVSEEVNGSVDADILPVYINVQNKYRSNTGDSSYVKAVSAGDVVKLVADKYSPTYRNYSLVTEYPVVGATAAFMTGTGINFYTDEVEITIPEDGYIVVTHATSVAPDNNNPQSFKLNGEELIFKGITDDITDIKREIDDIEIGNVTIPAFSHDIFDLESRHWIDDMVLNDKYSQQESIATDALITKIRNRRGEGVYQIAIISDTHGSGAYSWKSITNTSFDTCFRPISIFNKIVDKCNAAIHGGDISCDYGTSRQRYLQFMQEILRMFRFSNKPFFITKGNHDENNNNYIEADLLNIDWVNKTYYKRNFSTFTAVTENTWDGSPLYEVKQELISDREFKNFAQHWLCPSNAVWGNGAYYYYDIDAIKVRVIVANSFPVNDNHAVSENEEYLWFAQTALNFSEKEDRNDWAVLVLRHTQATSITDLANCINAFRSGGVWTFGTTTVDFSEMNGGGMKFIAHIHGHEHNWCFSNGAGFLDVGENKGYVNDSNLGDASQYGISVWSIDTAKGKIYEDTISGQTWCYNYITQKLEIVVGETTLMAESGLARPVTASSSDITKATCNNNTVTAVSVGDVTITMTGNNGDTYQYPITVVASY